MKVLLTETEAYALFLPLTKSGNFSKMCKDSLGNLLRDLSQQLHLSKFYINPFVRVTGINVMHESVMSNVAIAVVTDHKSAFSVQQYRRVNECQLKRAGDCLASA